MNFKPFLLLCALLSMSSTAMASSAQDSCSAILEAGIFREISQTQQRSYSSALKRRFCTYTESKAYDAYQKMFRDVKTMCRENGWSGNASVDLVIDFIPVGGSGGGSSYSKTCSATMFSRAQFSEHYRAYKHSSCSDLASYTNNDLIHEYVSREPDGAAVEAWRSCMENNSRQYISELYTLTRKYGDATNVIVQWSPGKEITAQAPFLDIGYGGLTNVELVSEVPGNRVYYNGESVFTVRTIDPKKKGSLTVYGWNQNANMNQSDIIEIPAATDVTNSATITVPNRYYRWGIHNADILKIDMLPDVEGDILEVVAINPFWVRAKKDVDMRINWQIKLDKGNSWVFLSRHSQSGRWGNIAKSDVSRSANDFLTLGKSLLLKKGETIAFHNSQGNPVNINHPDAFLSIRAVAKE